jgi:hypothetical protein
MSQFGATAVFGTLIYLLLKNQLKEAREERGEWLQTIREQNDSTRKLSDVLIEMRVILQQRNTND